MVVVVAATFASAAIAGSVAPMTVATMADHAGQVITGDVVSLRSYWTGEPRRIETEVTFSGVGYFKGAPADADGTFSLRVPGGTIGDMQMRIEGAPRFAAGESWVLFLLPTYRTFPVVGLDQGAFRVVRAADGTDRVYRGDRPVSRIDDLGFVHAEPGAAPVAGTAMTCDRFVGRIAPILAASRDHGLAEPAGRPDPVRHRAVPLKVPR